MFHFENIFRGRGGECSGIVALPVTLARIPRRWTLRNQRGDDGPLLTPGERHISPHADIPALIGAVVAQAVDDLDAGYSSERGGTANERYWRAQSYLWFFHGTPTGFERFTRRLGIDAAGRLPPHALLDDATALEGRRGDLTRLGLPVDLFDRRIDELRGPGL